jgi:biotin carboxyl carrier protein
MPVKQQFNKQLYHSSCSSSNPEVPVKKCTLYYYKSPIIGTFIEKLPDKPMFVEVGNQLVKGDVFV